MLSLRNKFVILIFAIITILSFQNCSKSQTDLTEQNSQSNSSKLQSPVSSPSYASAKSISTTQLPQVDALTVDSSSDNIYVIGENQIYKIDQNENVTLINDSQRDSSLQLQGVEIDPISQSVFSIEYRNGLFAGVKKYSLDGSSSDVLSPNSFKNGNYITKQSANSYSSVQVGSIVSFDLVRVKNVPLLKIVNSDSQYMWINLSDENFGGVLDAFAMNCLRTGDCSKSANLVSLVLSAEVDPLNRDKSNGDIVSTAGCQLQIVDHTTKKSSLIGMPCSK